MSCVVFLLDFLFSLNLISRLEGLTIVSYMVYEETCMSAADAGDLEALRFARLNGCPRDSRTASSAAWRNIFQAFKWVAAEGCPMNDEVSHSAAMSGSLSMLPWVKQGGYPSDRRTCSYAASGGGALRFDSS